MTHITLYIVFNLATASHSQNWGDIK
jgi:hypothetical protein